MGCGLIIAGFVFLVNPCFNLIDFLPDCIGFFLIFRGLSKMARLDADVEDARSIFSHLALIDLSKALAFYLLVMGRSGSTIGPDNMPLDALSMRASSETYFLVITLVYAIIEVIFFIPAVNKLFSGIDGISRKNSVPFPENASPARIVVIAFFIVRCSMSVVSELPALFLSSHYGDVSVTRIGPENLRPYLYVINSVVVIAFGAVFLYYVIRFFRGLKRNAGFVSAVNAAFVRFGEENPEVRLGYRMRSTAILFMTSSFLSIWITNGGSTLIPGAFCAILIVFTAVMLKDSFRGKFGFLTVAVPAALYGAVSSFAFALESRFFNDYSRFDVFSRRGAAKAYIPMAITEEIGFVLLAFSMIALSAVFYRTVRSHVSKAGTDWFVSEKVTFRIDRYRRELDAALKRRIVLARIGGIVHFAFLIALPVVEPFMPSVFPVYLEGAGHIDLPGHVMSYVMFAYFAVAALWIVFNLLVCLFSNAEMYRPMTKRRRT